MSKFENGWICKACWTANRQQDELCYRCKAARPSYAITDETPPPVSPPEVHARAGAGLRGRGGPSAFRSANPAPLVRAVVRRFVDMAAWSSRAIRRLSSRIGNAVDLAVHLLPPIAVSLGSVRSRARSRLARLRTYRPFQALRKDARRDTPPRRRTPSPEPLLSNHLSVQPTPEVAPVFDPTTPTLARAGRLDFGAYERRGISQLALGDADYRRWLSRHANGVQYERQIEHALQESAAAQRKRTP